MRKIKFFGVFIFIIAMIGCKKDIEEQVLTNPEKMHKFNIEQYDVELLSINDFPFEYAISVLYESDFYEFMNSILSVNPDRGSFIIKLQENKIYCAYLNTVLESEGNGNIIVQYGLVEDSSFVSSNFEEIMEWAHTQIEHGKIVSIAYSHSSGVYSAVSYRRDE